MNDCWNTKLLKLAFATSFPTCSTRSMSTWKSRGSRNSSIRLFLSLKISGPQEVPPAPPVVDPIPVILREAQQAFNAGEDDTARSAFERVLAENDPSNGPALYGLALIASREGDPLLASEYFSRTLDSQSAEPSMRVWSHIYLGRIYDLQCEREAAVGQYRSALEVGDDTQGGPGSCCPGCRSGVRSRLRFLMSFD